MHSPAQHIISRRHAQHMLNAPFNLGERNEGHRARGRHSRCAWPGDCSGRLPLPPALRLRLAAPLRAGACLGRAAAAGGSGSSPWRSASCPIRRGVARALVRARLQAPLELSARGSTSPEAEGLQHSCSGAWLWIPGGQGALAPCMSCQAYASGSLPPAAGVRGGCTGSCGSSGCSSSQSSWMCSAA